MSPQHTVAGFQHALGAEEIEQLVAQGLAEQCVWQRRQYPEGAGGKENAAGNQGMNGSNYSPPAATGNVFLDVGAGEFAASFIEQLSADGITAGCGNSNYYPASVVTRDQMAVFLVRTFGL